MSNAASDATALSAAKAARAALPLAGHHSFAKDKTASSSSFDDLLASIPDAPPEPRQTAADRAATAENRTTTRSERPERSARTDRTDRTERTANTRTSETQPEDGAAASADDAPATTAATSDASVDNATAKGDDSDSKASDSEGTDTSSPTQAAINVLAVPQTAVEVPTPQAAVIDPIAAAAAQGETAAKDGTAKSATSPVAATTAATTAATDAGQQQAAAMADQTTGLSADDAEVLSALAAKAQQGLKDAQGDKPGKKAATDKPAHAATSTGEAASSAGAGTPAQTDATVTTDARSSEAKPVTSELAKVAAEHQRGQTDAGGQPSSDLAPGAAGSATAATVKGPDSFAMHMMSPTANAIHAAGVSSETGKAQTSSDDKPVAIANVAVEVSARISSGKNQFDIRLDPEELGRIHVKVNVDRDGNISTHMVADRPDTLDLLRRDMQGLERALQDAGLKTSDNSLQFSLRDQTANQQQHRQDGQASRRPTDDDLTTTLTTTVIARDYGRYGQPASGLDIRV